MADDSPVEEEGFVQRLKESPRTVSALIIILIVAAAIYAFSGDDSSVEVATDTGNNLAALDGTEVEVAEEAADGAEVSDVAGQVAAETTTAAPGEEAAMEEVEEMAESAEIPEAERTSEGYVEVAQAGDGVTHLARRATTRWLTENQASYAVAAEHRIYIEDYIQNKIGTHGMEIGDTETVTFEMIEEAVAAAGELNEAQLQNLGQYTHVLL